MLVSKIVEVGDLDHVAGHVGCPFQNLGSNVVQERVGPPSAEDLDAVQCVVHEGEGHGGSGSYGFVADLVRVEAENRFAAIELAGIAE